MVRAMIHTKFVNDKFTAWVVPEYHQVMKQAMVDAAHLDRCDILDWPWTPTVETESDSDTKIDGMDCS